MAKRLSTEQKQINRVSGVSRTARYGRNRKGQALSQTQRRRNVYAALRKQAGLSAG